jgi:hypothetical protein
VLAQYRAVLAWEEARLLELEASAPTPKAIAQYGHDIAWERRWRDLGERKAAIAQIRARIAAVERGA